MVCVVMSGHVSLSTVVPKMRASASASPTVTFRWPDSMRWTVCGWYFQPSAAIFSARSACDIPRSSRWKRTFQATHSSMTPGAGCAASGLRLPSASSGWCGVSDTWPRYRHFGEPAIIR